VTSKILLVSFVAVSAATVLLGILPRNGAYHARNADGAELSDSQIRNMYPCTCYPGQLSGPGTIRLLTKASDSIALGRVSRFELSGDGVDMKWEAVIRTSRQFKGRCDSVYNFAIRSPEQNFGSNAEGRLFLVFIKEYKGELLWTLEPWLPEYEDIASGR
jgi:hypothetical protein